MEGKTIEIHYNAFETIEEQLKKQNYKCEEIDIFEQAKTSILYLYIQGFLTENEKDKSFNRLHKKIVKNLILEEK